MIYKKSWKYILIRDNSWWITHGDGYYRLKAIKNFGDVRRGNIGGYVKSYHSLSQKGKCWIYNEARVRDRALVIDNARVFNQSFITDDAVISDNAQTYGDSWIRDNARVSGNAKVFGKSRISNDTLIYGRQCIYDNRLVIGDI